MLDKIIMVMGVGSSKMIQLLFTFYLFHSFGYGSLATFVLILSLSAAMSSIVSLGGSPQIIRAGAYEDPTQYIQSIIGTMLLTSIIIIVFAICYVLFTDNNFFIESFTKFDYLLNTILVTLSFIVYSVIQSYLSYKQSYRSLGLYTLTIYSLPLLLSLVQGVITNSVKYVLFTYCLTFFLMNITILIKVIKGNISIKESIKTIIYGRDVSNKLSSFLGVASFGFIPMVGLYLLVRYVNNNYNSQDVAVFSVAFQFFQIGVFLPGVLGSIFVPMLIKNKNRESIYNMKKIYIAISIVWVAICIFGFYPLFYLYKFNYSYGSVSTFLLLQTCVVLASIQAFYIQNYVAIGGFLTLTKVSLIWLLSAIVFQLLLPSYIYFSSAALLIAYIVSNVIFFVNDKKIFIGVQNGS